MQYRIYGLDAISNMPRHPLDVEAETEGDARQQAKEQGMAVQHIELILEVPERPRVHPSIAPATRSKVSELGIFALGLGVLFLVIPLWLTFMMQLAGESPPVYKTALFLLPGAIMALVGILLLAIRNKYFVKITVVVLTLAFLVDALLSFNPIKWAISGACLYLVWRTGRQALVELQMDQGTG